MALEKRDNSKREGRNTTGIFLGKVVNHLDTTYMGGIQVEILKRNKSGGVQGVTVNCKYASPFFGQTPYIGLGQADTYEDTQKSYGFWAVPPDIGTQVIVLMPEGDYAQAYWVACVPETGMNFMTPGNAGTTFNNADANVALPVGEYNKKTTNLNGTDPTKAIKPAIEKDRFTRYDEAGLKTDHIRGSNTSSARREVPSKVFGWSTPGPEDFSGPTHEYGATPAESYNRPSNRLGGSSFVMDDGDMSLRRKTKATEGPIEYANHEAGDFSGDPTLPANDLVRIQTRMGHQILLHNTEDLIYISHGSGNSWIEMTANGKIDIYSKDSISVNSDNDINFNAGRDINFAAVEDINIIADKDIKTHSLNTTTQQAVNFVMDISDNSDVRIGKESKTYIGSTQHLVVEGDRLIVSKSNIKEHSELGTFMSSGGSLEVGVVGSIDLDGDSLLVNSGGQVNGTLDVDSISAGSINGTSAGGSWTDGGGGDDQILGPHSFAWGGKNIPPVDEAEEAREYEDEEFAFYVKRIPKHEPWEEHENVDPKKFAPDETQSTEKERPAEEESEFQFPPIDDTFNKG